MIDKLSTIRNIVGDKEVTLIAATKTQTKKIIDEFCALAPDFVLGENKVQELLEKYDERYTWHFIGQLQTNKVKYIIDKVELIHSLDRIELAKEIDKRAKRIDKVQNVLIEINMGNEINKGGVDKDFVCEFIQSLEGFDNLNIQGVMSVMPNLDDKVELERLYSQLQVVFNNIKEIKQNNVNIKYLSAGMSNDYQLALEYGANMIRLGRSLFGERVYKNSDIS